jgi:hypothetical protein
MHHGACRQGQSNDIYEKVWSICVGASYGGSLQAFEAKHVESPPPLTTINDYFL